MAVLSIEEVLAAEALELQGDTEVTRNLIGLASGQDDQDKREHLNSDLRAHHSKDAAAVRPRGDFYVALNQLNRAALCFSGGGIRSATFCLGVLQALAGYDLSRERRSKRPAVMGQPVGAAVTANASLENLDRAPEVKQPKPAEKSALGCFHYLSTVSGGGYIGSWLSCWRHRKEFAAVVEDLTRRPNGSDIEPPEVSWLRAYSNYLTPELGLTSADSWAAVAICARNLILNWLVIVPFVCIALLLLKLTAAISVLIAHTVNDSTIVWIAALGVVFLVAAQAFTNSHRPPRRAADVNTGERLFLLRDFSCSFASAIFLTIFFSSRYFWSHFEGWAGVTAGWPSVDGVLYGLHFDLKLKWLLVMAVVGIPVYAVGWIAAGRLRKGCRDFLLWAACGSVYGALIGLGAYLFWRLGPYEATLDNIHCLLLSVILGVPWAIMAQLAAGIVFVGLTSDEDKADSDREWLGRAAGWLVAGAVLWATMAFLVFAGGYLVQYAVALGHLALVKAGGVAGVISGLVTAFLGSSSKTSAKSASGDQPSVISAAYNIALAVAGPVFVACLIIGLSAMLDQLLFADALAVQLQLIKDATSAFASIISWLIAGLVITGAIASIASLAVNVNRFSLHALYRNRLVRCYLGASNEKRDPDLFSGFDFNDNVCVRELWPPQPGRETNSFSLFHVVNIALNVVSTKRLAWQERKAESFTVTPMHCGSDFLGFRSSKSYGGQGGLSLGTAMAISGAAVSSNMGYHSSPSLSLLLTLFNVRLGWWLGNPGKAGEKTYHADGPLFAARPLFAEAFGLTTDTSPYVYLSDGGHFENLGLYEMVRRRCRLIVLVDAGCDPDFTFEDLGNAVRKIYIDLGIRITFKDLAKLKNRPSAKSLSRAVRDAAALASLATCEAEESAGDCKTKAPGETPYHAVGVIHYKEASRTVGDDRSALTEDGYILYIKPAYHDTETSAGIRSYATANPEFPHETTADQWFTESQFESYRALGLDITKKILCDNVVLCPETGLTFHGALNALPSTVR